MAAATVLLPPPLDLSRLPASKTLDSEMIDEEEEDDMMEDVGQKRRSAARRTLLMMKRSRSLPQEEFIYLSGSQDSQLIRRTDSVISGHSTTRY